MTRGMICTFRGDYSEDLVDMWRRFDSIRMTYPHHQCSKGEVLHCFCDGITDQARNHLNNLLGGSYLDYTPDELERALELHVTMAEKWRSSKKDADGFNSIVTTVNNRVIRSDKKEIVELSAQTPMDEVVEEVSADKIEGDKE